MAWTWQVCRYTTLYSYAKRQDPYWTRKLPESLRFGAAGTAVGYSEADPVIDFDQVIVHNTVRKNEVIMQEEDNCPSRCRRCLSQKRGRPKRSNDDAARDRENDVLKVQEILSDLRKNEPTY